MFSFFFGAPAARTQFSPCVVGGLLLPARNSPPAMRKQGARVSPRPVRAGGEGPVLAATPGSDHGRQTDGGRAKRPQLATYRNYTFTLFYVR